jgi:hypothetical protein
MKTIDVSLFEGNPFTIKTAHRGNPSGQDYVIDRVDAVYEIKLMQEQEELTQKASKWKTLEQEDFNKWKKMLINIIKTNDNTLFNEEDINKLMPVHIIGILMALITFLNERTKIIYEGLAPEMKQEIEKVQEDVKKKTIESLL